MQVAIAGKLDEEYMRTLEAVARATAGSAEAKWQLEKLSELHRQRMNEIKLQAEELSHLEEMEIKEKEAAESRKDRIIRTVLEGAAILVPVTVSSYWMSKGLKFEETGAFTSRTGQWLSNHLRLFRK